MANTVDPVLSYHTSQERQPAAVPELPNNQPHQSPKVILKIILNRLKPQAEEVIAEEQAGRLLSRKEHHRADLQPTNHL